MTVSSTASRESVASLAAAALAVNVNRQAIVNKRHCLITAEASWLYDTLQTKISETGNVRVLASLIDLVNTQSFITKA